MKCPKCGYLGYETTDRCRNCGYDFSLAADSGAVELPLHADPSAPSAGGASVPSAADIVTRRTPRVTPPPFDLTLGDSEPRRPALDLDRLIGVPDPEPESAPVDERVSEPKVEGSPVTPPEVTPVVEEDTLPLFDPARDPSVEPPYVAPPRPAGPPLSVRRATSDVTARTRVRTTRPRREEPPLQFPSEPAADEPAGAVPETRGGLETSAPPPATRLMAAGIDVALLGGICLAVLYLTLRLAELSFADIGSLPVVPMSAFLLLLILGYLAAFVAAGGQTIGKMAAGLRVVHDEDARVGAAVAVRRALGTMAYVVTLGLAWLPALFAEDGRGLADRLAGTRVVIDRSQPVAD